MIISDIFKSMDKRGFARYAAFYKNENALMIRDDPYYGSYAISLEGVSYLIKDSVLYVTGNVIEFTYMDTDQSVYAYDLTKFKVTQQFLDTHEVDTNCIIRNYKKRWLFFRKNIPIVIDISFNENGRYFAKKQRQEFDMCMSSFKLVEK